MFALFASALGLKLPETPSTRRYLVTGAGWAAVGVALPVTAREFLNPLDPKVVGGPRGLLPQSDISVPKGEGVVNTGVLLLREAFDGETPAEGLLSWLEAHLSPDFEASFDGGKVKQNKEVRVFNSREPPGRQEITTHSTHAYVPGVYSRDE